MLAKHSVNLSISAGGLNLLPKFQKKGGRGLGMIIIFRWGLLGKMEVRFFWREVLQFLHKNKLKSEIFNGKKGWFGQFADLRGGLAKKMGWCF